MTSTSLAAATGSPSFDRRAFIASLAAAGVLTSSTELPAVAGQHPDAELLHWEALYHASQARQDKYDRQVDEAFKRYLAPPIPEALFQREIEPRYLVSTCRSLETDERDGERCYFYSQGVEDLTHAAKQYASLGEAYSDSRFFSEEARARVREISTAHRAWKAAVRMAEDAAGITAPRAGGDAESKIMDDLTDKIALTRATTMEGLRTKARFALIFLFDDVDFLERELLPEMVARSMSAYTVLGVSLILDLTKLDLAASDRLGA